MKHNTQKKNGAGKTAQKTVKTVQAVKTVSPPKFTWSKFCRKILLLFISVAAVVVYTDSKDYFKADQTNNHVDRKWKSYYNFTKNRNVDVLLCGNSHIITGIEPFVLSLATSSNCFILGTPGVDIRDVYFTLGEALKYTKPKLVVIETYVIGGSEEKDKGSMYQIMSFEAHRDFLYKLRMMPELFDSDSWIKAWSPSVRNHSFLLTNKQQIEFNIKNRNKKTVQNKLDLGRFARFSEGLQPDILAKYDSIGAPVDGNNFHVSKQSSRYLKRVMDLCSEKHVPVLFLTVPMYYKHISNYDKWKDVLNEELKKYPTTQWIDWQMPYDSARFTPEAFENTYENNQHLSNYGMTVTAYKLADFLVDNKAYNLPDRSKEAQWIADFKDQPHFIFNQNLPANMTSEYYSVTKDKQINGFLIKELLVQQNKDHNMVILKTEKRPNMPSSIDVVLKCQYNAQTMFIPIKMNSSGIIFPPRHNVYTMAVVKDLKVLDIGNIIIN
jgi:hypothetical protein